MRKIFSTLFLIAALITSMASLVSCGKDKRDTPPPPTGTPNDDVKVYSYSVDAVPLQSGDEIRYTSYFVSQKIKDQDSVTITFKFNSGPHSHFKILREKQTFSCEIGYGKKEQRIFKISDPSHAVYENVDMLKHYVLEPNTSYAYQVTYSSLNCENIDFKVAMWLGGVHESPSVVRDCIRNNKRNNGASFLYFLDDSPITVFANYEKKIFGNKLICGQSISGRKMTIQKNYRTNSARGKMISNLGDLYKFVIRFNNDSKSGLYKCSENNETFKRARLSSCIDKVLDKNLFHF